MPVFCVQPPVADTPCEWYMHTRAWGASSSVERIKRGMRSRAADQVGHRESEDSDRRDGDRLQLGSPHSILRGGMDVGGTDEGWTWHE